MANTVYTSFWKILHVVAFIILIVFGLIKSLHAEEVQAMHIPSSVEISPPIDIHPMGAEEIYKENYPDSSVETA